MRMENNLTPGERLALLKEQNNGSLETVQQKMIEFTYIVYDTNGNIYYKGISEPDMSKFDEDFKFYKFNTSDVQIIDSKNQSAGQFLIEEDEHGICHIKIKSIEDVKIKATRDFLSEIEKQLNDFDVHITYKKNKWIITSNVEHKQNFIFYVTPPGDPHILYERVNVPMKLLNHSQTIEVDKNTNTKSFSLYTHKIFDKYSRS